MYPAFCFFRRLQAVDTMRLPSHLSPYLYPFIRLPVSGQPL